MKNSYKEPKNNQFNNAKVEIHRKRVNGVQSGQKRENSAGAKSLTKG
jgi:hypothetical protein